MSRSSSYAEIDEKPPADDPNAPTAEVDFHQRYTTGATDPLPVLGDHRPVEDPIDPEMDDADKQIRRDEAEMMDRSNVMLGRTHKVKSRHGYVEEVDESIGFGGCKIQPLPQGRSGY